MFPNKAPTQNDSTKLTKQIFVWGQKTRTKFSQSCFKIAQKITLSLVEAGHTCELKAGGSGGAVRRMGAISGDQSCL
jgi:hypothetical protein